jgi:hypothetical protein
MLSINIMRARYSVTSACIVESVKVWSVCVRKNEGYVEYDIATVFRPRQQALPKPWHLCTNVHSVVSRRLANSRQGSCFLWGRSPTGVWAASFLRVLDHTHARARAHTYTHAHTHTHTHTHTVGLP